MPVYLLFPLSTIVYVHITATAKWSKKGSGSKCLSLSKHNILTTLCCLLNKKLQSIYKERFQNMEYESSLKVPSDTHWGYREWQKIARRDVCLLIPPIGSLRTVLKENTVEHIQRCRRLLIKQDYIQTEEGQRRRIKKMLPTSKSGAACKATQWI